MKKNSKNLLSVSVIIFFMIIGIASSGTKNLTFSKEGGQIPPEFGIQNDTLLVISHSEDWGYNKYLKKNFSGNYFGNYKIITKSELKNYPTEKYRFVFDHKLNHTTKISTTNSNGNSNPQYGGTTINTTKTSSYVSSDVFLITDRKTDKDFVTKSSAFYSKLMTDYIKSLENIRRK